MHAEVIYGDDKKPLGISLQQSQNGENQILERCMNEGILPVSFNAREGLVVTFGQRAETVTSDDTDGVEEPTEPSRWAG